MHSWPAKPNELFFGTSLACTTDLCGLHIAAVQHSHLSLPAQVCLGAALGISKPSALLWFKSALFTYALGFLMLSMGLTLTFDDFRQVHSRNAHIAAKSWFASLTADRSRASVPCFCALL